MRIEWFIKEVSDKVMMTMEQRVLLAVNHLRDKVVKNISRPVTKTRVTGAGGRSFTRVSDRSKPGEFPKADTTLLMKSIFGDVTNPSEGVYDGFVGMPLMYGLVLETKMSRAFLSRTLYEEQSRITRLLTGPISD